MRAEIASLLLWAAWALSWVAAALWSGRTEARAGFLDEAAYRATIFIGALVLFLAIRFPLDQTLRLWRLPAWADWTATALVGVGFAFCWWARLTLGSLWSSAVTRKATHVVVRTGPYGLVRHPIYTGLILSTLAFVLQTGRLVCLLGGAVMILGYWMKARLEERFLGAELGAGAYDDYRRATPMLTPFWPRRR